MHHIMGLGSLLEFKLCYKAGLSEFLRAEGFSEKSSQKSSIGQNHTDFYAILGIVNSMNNKSQVLLNRISAIREEHDTEKRLRMLLQLNDSLSEDMKLDMPSLITNAYVRKALDMIQERLLVST